MPSFLVADRSGGNFNLALSDGGNLPVFPAPGGSSNAGLLIFPTIAAMAAFDTTLLINPGQQALVQSNGSLWTLRSQAGLPTDGITIVQGTPGEPVKWIRENVGGYQALVAQQQPSWVVDAQNVSGFASDENDGKTVLTPLLTKAEIQRRWGNTWRPNALAGNNHGVTIIYLSADTGGTDPGLFEPYFQNGSTLTHTPLTPFPAASSFTGTLNVVQAKNAASNIAFAASFNTTTGAIAVGMVLVNATRGNSIAHVDANLGAGTFGLSQPLQPYVLGTLPSPTNVDTWAAGDAITGYQFLKIDLAVTGGQASGLNSGFTPQHVVYHLNVIDSDATGGGLAGGVLDGQAYACFIECQVSRRMTYRNGQLNVPVFMNCGFLPQAPLHSTDATFFPIFAGGYITSGCQLKGFDFRNFVNFLNTGNFVYDPQDLVDAIFVGPIAGSKLTLKGQWNVVTSGVISGSTLDVRGQLQYTTTATAQLPIGTKQLGGVATAYSAKTTAGVTAIAGGIALTSANLDAAAGPAGFGGSAEANGYAISNGAQP